MDKELLNGLFMWDVSRICCPSQGYFYFYDEQGDYWVLYLRWRSNPWTAELMRVSNPYKNEWDWDTVENVPLSKVYDDEEECEEVMKDSYAWLKSRFPEVEFPEEPGINMYIFPEITEDDIN